MNTHPVTITHTNYKGVLKTRSVVPLRLWYGANEWHGYKQYLLDAIDDERKELRTFTLQDLHRWTDSGVPQSRRFKLTITIEADSRCDVHDCLGIIEDDMDSGQLRGDYSRRNVLWTYTLTERDNL